MQTKVLALTILGLVPLFLTHCMSYDYSQRIVQQGNLLPESKVQRLKIGMSKQDVATLMGTPLLSSTFNNERWDYAYNKRKGVGALKAYHLSLYFSHGKLAHIEQTN